MKGKEQITWCPLLDLDSLLTLTVNIPSVLAVSDAAKSILLCSFLPHLLTSFQNKVSAVPIQFHAHFFFADAAVQILVLNALLLPPVTHEPGAALLALEWRQNQHRYSEVYIFRLSHSVTISHILVVEIACGITFYCYVRKSTSERRNIPSLEDSKAMFSIYPAFRETVLMTRIKTTNSLLALLVSLCFRSGLVICRVLQYCLIFTPACCSNQKQ